MLEDTKKKERRKMPKKNKHKTDVSGEKGAKKEERKGNCNKNQKRGK